MIRFARDPAPSELPTRFPSPFDRSAVHPLARRAAEETLDELRAPTSLPWRLDQPDGGKMFGVLVVTDSRDTIGYLRAFSGMLSGTWFVPGWAPPVFDTVAYDAVWIDGDAEMRALAATHAMLAGDAARAEELALFDTRRTARSQQLMQLIQAAYRLSNARGDVRTLHELFAPALPPGGAGDCAAPKLLAEAYRRSLRPLALAEVWWGAPPRSGDRRAGSFYPACHGKCGPILTHMLDGLPVDAPPVFGATRFPDAEPTVVCEDAWIAIVEKPCGMLSVPGRGALLQDCVATRVHARYPDATGPLLVHRLDLDTSGLMLIAKDAATYVLLQRLFATRAIKKRYIAWLDGDVAGECGTIALPLRVDIDDRPRHIHDAVFGKPALTSWRVLLRESGRTRVELTPHTGRTHQLRVHASHPLGLDAPIVGDRLYGRCAPDEHQRLLLHAESVTFVHPVTGAELSVERPAPF